LSRAFKILPNALSPLAPSPPPLIFYYRFYFLFYWESQHSAAFS